MKSRIIANQSGMALILTILVVSLLSITVLDSFHSAWIQSALASSFKNDTKAFYAAKSGQEIGKKILIEDAQNSIQFDALSEEWAQGSIPLPIGNEYAFVSISDESGKFDVNSMVSSRGYPNDRRIDIFRRLLAHLEQDPGLADAIVDWLDSNSTPRPGGAEDGFYLSLKAPYTAKNAMVDSVDELLLVKGITAKVLEKLRPSITAWSSGKININTASPTLLLSLDDDMTESMVNGIIRSREEKPFKRNVDIKKTPGISNIYPRIALDINVKSNHYMIYSTATIGENTKAIRGVYKRSASRTNTLYYKVF